VDIAILWILVTWNLIELMARYRNCIGGYVPCDFN